MTFGKLSRFCQPALFGLAALLWFVATWRVSADDKVPAPVAAPATASQKSPATEAADRLEALLKANGLFYQRVETPGQEIGFTIGIQDNNGGSSIGHFYLHNMNWKFSDGTEAFLVHSWSQVLTSKDVPVAVKAKVAEFNDTMNLTGGCVNDAGVYAYEGFLLDPKIDTYSVNAYVYNLHWCAVGLKAALAPILKGLSSEK